MTQQEKVKEHVSRMMMTLGVKSVRMDDVATSLGMSKRTLYEMFGDKEELLYQCIRFFEEQSHLRCVNQVASLDNCLEVILVGIRDMVAVAPVMGRLHRNLRRFYPHVYARLEEGTQHRVKGGLRQWLMRCVEDGYMTSTSNCDFVVNILHNSVQGAMVYDDSETRDPLEIVSLMSYSLVIFIRGLCTPKGVEIIDRCFDKYFGNIPAPDTLIKEQEAAV